MRRLSTFFLLSFVVLALTLGGVVAWKTRARRAPEPPPLPNQADYRVNEVHISETLEGNLRWTLDADHAEVFDKEHRTVMQTVSIRVFSEKTEWRVTADKGVLDNESRDVSLTGNVVVTSSDGLTLTTNALSWRNSERNLFTDDVVEVRREGTTIVGRGLDVRMKEQHAVLGKRVRVVITNRANANLGFFPRSGS
jgi:LPS export ABC transporter protein LptC